MIVIFTLHTLLFWKHLQHPTIPSVFVLKLLRIYIQITKLQMNFFFLLKVQQHNRSSLGLIVNDVKKMK